MANDINAAGYETKPWWPYVRELMSNQVTVESVTILENGVYTAPAGKAYSPVTVNVPTYEVDSLSVTENGTYTAEAGKAYSPVVVNVPTGIEGFSNGNITVNLHESVQEFELDVMPYVNEGVPTVDHNCIAYESSSERFNAKGVVIFAADHTSIEFLYMKDAAFFMPILDGVEIQLVGNAEKMTITNEGESFTIIKATGDFTIQVSPII